MHNARVRVHPPLIKCYHIHFSIILLSVLCTAGMGRKIKSCSYEKFSEQKDHKITRPPVIELGPVIKKLGTKHSIQKKVSLKKNISACTVSQLKEIKYDASQHVPSVYLSLDTSHDNVNINDSDSEEIPIKVSSPQERETRRLARVKQLEKMKAFEAAFSRQNRYQKRANNVKSVKKSPKKVKWKKEGLCIYHFYNGSEPSSDTD